MGRLNGVSVGRYGRLHVEGLGGDLWRDFTVSRLTIADQNGVWLDVHRLEIDWRPVELVTRRVHIADADAGQVQLIRRPVAGPAGAPGPAPVALTIDRLTLQAETLPAASVVRGLFGLSGGLDTERNGAISGNIDAKSRLHAGDGLTAQFDFGVRQRLAINAQAREAQGGALAGLLGLPTGQPFSLDARVGGAKGDGWLRLRASTGAQSIAEADGTWTQAGGQAAGRLSLAASHWTAPWMHALGPEVRFTAAGRPVNGDLFGVALSAQSDNATLQAVGVADATRFRVPDGLGVQAHVSDLHRLLSTPDMGQGSLVGRFVGGWSNAHLTGNASIMQVKLGGYSLARASGPIDLVHDKGAWRLRAQAVGEQGRGAGLLAALIGGRPQASLDATRLADGRILIQSLKGTGAGLNLNATGQHGLFGDLSFKGDLKLTNLAAARTGARGVIQARWSAGQSGRAKPWVFAFNGDGAGFASGFDELDRLVGVKPHLSAEGQYDRAAFLITKSDLTGSAANAQASGEIATAGGLKLAIKWTAHGPFEVGLVEIAGQAQGSGAVTGTLSAPRADLMADFEQIDLPELSLKPAHVVLSFIGGSGAVNGDVVLTASSDYGPAHARAGFRFVQGGLALSGIDAAGGGVTASGDLTLTRNTPSQADLTLSVGPGAVLTQGHADARLKIIDAPGGATIALSLRAASAAMRNAPLIANSADLTASGPLSHAAYKLSGDLLWSGTPLRLQGDGVASQVGSGYAVSFDGTGKVRRTDFRTLSPVLIAFGGPTMTAKASVAVGAGRIDLDAQQTGHAFNATAKLGGIDIAILDADFAGKIDGDLALAGHDQVLGGTLTAHLAGARTSDAPAKLGLDGDLKADLAAGRLDITAALQNQAGGRANLTLALPAESSAEPFRVALAETRPMTGRFDVEGEVAPIWELMFGEERTLGGQVNAQGDIGGTMDEPEVVGHATLANGVFEDSATGLKLRNVAVNAEMSQSVITVHSFTGADSKAGSLSGQGQISLAKGGQSSLVLTLQGFQLLDNETASVIASGAVTISRDAVGNANLAGRLSIDRADISAQTSRAPPGVVRMDVVERNRPQALNTGLQAQAPNGGLAAGLNITLHAPGGVFVRGLGLNAEMSLDATVTGDTNHPILEGTARVVRGDYQFAGQRFEIDNRGTVTLASAPENIRLDLTATRDDPSLTAIITIKGTAAKPDITLSSSPTLPSDEVLSQVLFGRSAAQLSPVEAAQLAAAVTSLATGGGFDIMGGLQNFAKLDRLALGGDTASGMTVSGGKYIGKNVYLELTGGGRQGPSAQVEVTARRGLSVVSQIGGEVGAKLAIRWRRDYGQATAAAKP